MFEGSIGVQLGRRRGMEEEEKEKEKEKGCFMLCVLCC